MGVLKRGLEKVDQIVREEVDEPRERDELARKRAEREAREREADR